MCIVQKTRGLLLAVCVWCAGMDCRNPAQKQDSKDVAEDKNDWKFEDKDQAKTASFVVEAVAGLNEMLQGATLAAQKSNRPEIKEIAASLKEEYTVLLERFRSFAAKRNISLPAGETKEARDAWARLAALPPPQFDKQWCEWLMRQHKKAIDAYETTAPALPNDSLQKLAAGVLPPIRRQYDKLMQYHHKL